MWWGFFLAGKSFVLEIQGEETKPLNQCIPVCRMAGSSETGTRKFVSPRIRVEETYFVNPILSRSSHFLCAAFSSRRFSIAS